MPVQMHCHVCNTDASVPDHLASLPVKCQWCSNPMSTAKPIETSPSPVIEPPPPVPLAPPPIKLFCPTCGSKGMVPARAAGSTITCKKCGGRLQVPKNPSAGEAFSTPTANLPIPIQTPPVPVQIQLPQPVPELPPLPAAPTQPVMVVVNTTQNAAPAATPAPQHIIIHTPGTPVEIHLGIWACVAGSLALLSSFIPCMCIVSPPLALVGLALGIIGLVFSIRNSSTPGKIMAGIGVGASVVGLCVFAAWFIYMQVQNEQQQRNQPGWRSR